MIDYTRGILNPHIKKYHMVRTPPCEALQPLIEFFYEISWKMPVDEKQLLESLPAPSVHLIFMNGEAEISGPIKRRFSYLMENQGYLFGAKFWPGSFRMICDECQSNLADKRLPAKWILGDSILPITDAFFCSIQAGERLSIVQNYLRYLYKPNEEQIPVIKKIFADIEQQKTIFTVAQLAALQKMTVRSLQRLFKEYVGVSPKWAIQLFRLREAAQQMESQNYIDLSQLAFELGYSDQAHFSKDFKRITGKTPKSYVLSCPEARRNAVARRPKKA
jgi:AraC-like DNA-binding protein